MRTTCALRFSGEAHYNFREILHGWANASVTVRVTPSNGDTFDATVTGTGTTEDGGFPTLKYEKWLDEEGKTKEPGELELYDDIKEIYLY